MEVEPSEAMFILVVVASAGRDRLDAPAFLVSCRDGLRCCLVDSSWGVDEEVRFDATFCATEMLSRATSVTGAALDDQTPGYQFYQRAGISHIQGHQINLLKDARR